MKKVEITMSKKFYDYALKNINGIQNIKAQRVVSELLKNKDIKKPYNQGIKNTCIADLKYKGYNIKQCGMIISEHKIILGY